MKIMEQDGACYLKLERHDESIPTCEAVISLFDLLIKRVKGVSKNHMRVIRNILYTNSKESIIDLCAQEKTLAREFNAMDTEQKIESIWQLYSLLEQFCRQSDMSEA